MDGASWYGGFGQRKFSAAAKEPANALRSHLFRLAVL